MNAKILTSLFILSASSLLSQTPFNYWTSDNGTNPTNQIIDNQGNYNLNYASYSPGSVNISNILPKVGNYIQLRQNNNIIQASSSTFPISGSFAVEFIMRTTKNWIGGEFMKDMGGGFAIGFEIPNNGYARPVIRFSTNTGSGSGVYDELALSLDGIGRKNYGWYADGNWHHFLFQYNSASGLKEIWIDGERPTSDFYKNTTPGNINRVNSALGIVINSNTSYRKVDCDIDEVAIYTTTISPQLIQQHIQNINSAQHYATSTSIVTPPNVSPTSAPIDTMEFAVGFLNQVVTYSGSNITATKQPNSNSTKQLQTFPLPRYRLGSTLPTIFNWCDLTFMSGKGQTLPIVTTPALFTPISTSQYLQNITDLLHETTYNWNYSIASPEVGRTGEYGNTAIYANSRISKFANDSTQYQNTIITLKAQISGCLECSKTLANSYYLQNASGTFLTSDGNTTAVQAYKVLRPSNNPSNFAQDGQTMKGLVQAYVNALPNRNATNKISEINENGEILAWLTNAAMSLDPVVTADKNSSGLSWEDYQGQRFYELEKTSYRDIIFSIPGLSNSTFSQYQLDGFPEYKFKWSKARQILTYRYNNQYLSTGDLYPLYPYGWRNITGAWNGIRHFTKARQAEIAVSDTFFRPFINAGFSYDETTTVRPAQYLGLLKIMTGLGAISFYNGYFTVAQPYQIPANWIWQVAMPSYAQATNSKIESIYKNSYLLPGDGVWNPDDATSGSSYLFNGGDFRKPCVVRKWNGGSKYIIYTAFMNNTNMQDTSTYTGSVSINFDGINNVVLNTRRQGSVYLFDNTVNPPTIVQLDGWHERLHPERWSQDIIVEAELADAGTFTTKVEGATGYNFTNSTTYVALSGAQTLTYNVQRSENSAATRYFWIRCRSNTGTATSATISLNGTAGKKIDCITNTSWQWYRVENITSSPISYSLAAKGKYNLTVSSGNGNLEVDKIALIVSSADVYNATVTNCGGTATITPSAATTFCQGDSVYLVASAGSAYLWSTGSTSNTIVVKTSGTYTVTVTVGGNNIASSPVTVTVIPLPTATITPNAGTSICAGATAILTANAGVGLLYQWKLNNVDIPFSNIVSYAAPTAGTYTCMVTNSNGCTSISNSISISALTSPTATITPNGNTTFCQGSSIQLSASPNTTYLWSTGATTQNISVSIAGTFTVTVTGSNGCKAISSPISTSVTPLPTSVISCPQTTICNGSTTTITAQTGSGYSYQWQANNVNIAGATSNIYIASSGAPYKCIVTANGCSVTSNTISITVNMPPTTANAGVNQNICVDSCILSGNIPSSGAGLWTLVSGTGNIVSPSQYNSKVTNINNGTSVFRWTISNSPCTPSTSDVTITRAASNPASVSISVSANPFCNGQPVTFYASPVNGGSATYQWYKNGAQVGNSIPTYSGTFSNNDSVWVVMTSSLSCATGSPATSNKITLVSSSISANISALSYTTFCAGDSVLLKSNSGVGYTYQWYNTSGLILSATDTIYSAKTSGIYNVLITNSLGCSASSNTLTVTVNPLPSVVITPNGSTSFCTGGSVVLSSTSASSYLWSTSATTQSITVSSSGSYTVTITNGNGCSNVSSPITVTNGALPTATITPNTSVSICSGQSQTFTANAGSGLTYLWYKSGINTGVNTQTFAANSPGNYYVVVTNASFCTKSSDTVNLSVQIPQPSTISNSRPLSFCGNDSTVLTANSGNAYLWSNGALTRSIIVKNTGSYVVTVTTGGCSSISTPVQVNAFPAFSINISPSRVPTLICGNIPNQITLTASAASSYMWSNGATSIAISPSAGTYYVVASNSSGCTATSNSITVTDTCIATTCGIPFGLYTDQNNRNIFCFGNNCAYARANWASGNYSADAYILYYKNLKTGQLIKVKKSGDMRRAYMYNIQNNTNYQWWITAVCNGVETNISEIINFKTK
jgi:hypothetical protein